MPTIGPGSASQAQTVTSDTELPAAVTAADAMANPTAPPVLAHFMGWNGSGWDRVQVIPGATVDGINGSYNAAATFAYPKLFNGTTFDRERNNTELTLLASAARTANTNSPDQTNQNWRGGHVVVNVTVLTTSVIPTIQAKDPISGTYYTILTGASIASTGITILKVYPGITAAANVSASDVLPRTFRVAMTHVDQTTTMTYSVAFVGIV